MTTPHVPSAEEFFDEIRKARPYMDDVNLMEAYARAVLEAAEEVAHYDGTQGSVNLEWDKGYMMGRSDAELLIRALKEDL